MALLLNAGDTVQRSYSYTKPSPAHISQPEECGEKTGNLMDLEAFLKREGATYTKNGDTFTINMSSNLFAHPWYVSDEDTYLSISGIMETLSGTNIRIYIVKKDGTVSGSIALGGTGNVRKTENRLGAGIKFDYTYLGQCTVSNLMLNTGPTALLYEPYGFKLPLTLAGQTQTVYLPEPIRKIGDHSDTVSSDGTVTRKIYKHIINGTENVFNSLWGAWSWSFPSGFTVIPDAITTPKVTTVICSHYASRDNCASGAGLPASYGDKIVCFRDYLSTLLIKDTRFSTREEFAEYLQQQYSSGTPVTIWYVLANPVTETVTVPTLLPAKGSNTLTVGTTLQPSEVSITGGIRQQ